MQRHACGYELAEKGIDTRLIQDDLRHRNIRHTVHYTAGNAARFAQTWKKQRLEAVSEENERYGMMRDSVAGVMRTIIAQCQFALSVFRTVLLFCYSDTWRIAHPVLLYLRLNQQRTGKPAQRRKRYPCSWHRLIPRNVNQIAGDGWREATRQRGGKAVGQ